MLRYSLTAVFTRVDCFEQLFVQQCDVVPQRLMAEGFFILAPAETRGITSNYLTKGDWRRDAVLYIGRDRGRMKLMELSAGIGNIDYAAVGGAVSRVGKRLAKGELRTEVRRIESRLSNS